MFVWCNSLFKVIDGNIFLQLNKGRKKKKSMLLKISYFQPQGRLFALVLESIKGRADGGEESSQR